MTYMYIMYFIALLPVSKKSRNFASIQRTLVTNFIGNIIGWQAQEHIEIVEAIWQSREFLW